MHPVQSQAQHTKVTGRYDVLLITFPVHILRLSPQSAVRSYCSEMSQPLRICPEMHCPLSASVCAVCSTEPHERRLSSKQTHRLSKLQPLLILRIHTTV